MSSLVVDRAARRFEVVELASVGSNELQRFWEREIALWRSRLLWDVSGAVSALRRAMQRGGVRGKALRTPDGIAAYSYYTVEGDRAVLSGLMLSPGPEASAAARALLTAVISEIRRRPIRRIESQFISFDAPALVPGFEALSFRTYWRQFLRAEIGAKRPRHEVHGARSLRLQPWKAWSLNEAALVMHGAHSGGVDAEMNELYRTTDGCRVLLNNILRQRGCGATLPQASAVARERQTDSAVGFTITTETSPRNGHLAQLAVLPRAQGTGVGRLLLGHAFARLQELGFETISLMVSSGNHRALALYRGMGFLPVFRFPVFAWERTTG
jgi:GNAT superfamily N-acetyltransferase